MADFGVYAPSPSPLTPAVDQCVDGFHFRGVKVLHHRRFRGKEKRDSSVSHDRIAHGKVNKGE